MTMKRCTAAVLLMLSLGALAAGRLSAAVADGVDTIRLPSHGPAVAGHEDEGAAASADPEDQCCIDKHDIRCMFRWPPCFPDVQGDVVVPNGPGVALPRATAAVAAAATETVSEEEERPWKCCDDTLCTRSAPPTCQCRDKVKKCAKACKHCEKAEDESNGASTRYVCRDLYFGWSPKCSKSVAADEFLRGTILAQRVARKCRMGHCTVTTNHVGGDDATAEVAAATDTASEMSVNDDGEEETRPWKCCDVARCTRSYPPTCQCMDKVKKCAKTCKSCKKVEGSSRYVCQDSYGGWPGETCTPAAPPPPPTFTPRGN